MKRTLILLGTCLAAFALCWPLAGGAHEPQAKQDKKSGKVGKIMQEKLKHSQKLLEGIALADYDKIIQNADALADLSTSEEWHVIKTPRYEMFSNEFKRTADMIVIKAKMKSIDGVTLAYFEMTMSCVRCHSYVKEVRDAGRADERWVAAR